MSGLIQSPAPQSVPSGVGDWKRLAVGVRADASAPPANPLFAALASLFPVEFQPCTNGGGNDFDALVVIGQDPEEIRSAAATGLPVFAVPAPASGSASTQSARFCLEDSPILSACWRGHCFQEPQSIEPAPLPASAGDTVLASQNGAPIWVQRTIEGTPITLAALPLPLFAPGDHLHEYLQSDNLLQLLPLLQFLRNLTAGSDWQSPPTPACLVVDDPNFYAMSYGHLDFRKLAASAEQQGFHASIATVPLDSWWISSQVSELFRAHAPRLSVLIHGNDHVRHELAHSASDAENLSLLAEALRRFQRLEQQPGVEVCRVMECPHGALSVNMLEPMAKLGYEAVVASIAHLLRYNPGTEFPASLGAEPTLLMKNAVPVIPRIRTVPGWQTGVRLAAFMRQPVILATHHWDFAGQRGLPEDFVGIVNSLRGVQWTTPAGAVRACYQFRQTGDLLHLKLGSRMVDVPVPPGAGRVMIYRPWLRGEAESEQLVVQGGDNELFRANSPEEVIGPIPLQESTTLRVASSLLNSVDCHSVPHPRFRYWPFLRKCMVEFRDRTRLPIHRESCPNGISNKPASRRPLSPESRQGSSC